MALSGKWNATSYRYACEHFKTLNQQLQQQESRQRYFFHFLTPRDYDAFFKFLREDNYHSFVSALDAALECNGGGRH